MRRETSVSCIRSCKEIEVAKPQSGLFPALDSPGTTSPKVCFFSRLRIRIEPRLGHSSRPWVKIAVGCP